MTAFQDVYPHVPASPSPKSRKGHRSSEVSGGHPLMPDTGRHVLARRSVMPYLAAVLLPLLGVLLVLYAVSLYGQPPASEVIPPALQVAVSPSACTFPDGS